MEIEYKGANAVVISTKKATIVVDPKISRVGLKDIVVKDAIQLTTTDEDRVVANQRLLIDSPGEYEVGDVSVKGIAAVRHIDSDDAKKSTMYALNTGDVRIGIIGHVKVDLTEQQLEELGTIDILIVPVGGGGYTLDTIEAITLTRKISPKVVIPTHYADPALTYEVPQAELDLFVKGLAAAHETVPKFKIKAGVLPEVLTVIEITRTS